MSPLRDFLDFRVLGKQDYGEVLKLVEEEFVPRAPICSTLKLSREEGSLLFEGTVKRAVDQRVSIGAFDKRTNKLVGVRLNSLGKLPEGHGSVLIEEMSLKVKQVAAGLKALLGDDVSKTVGTTNYMEYSILCTHPDYGNMGIGTEMYKRSEEIARREGCEKIFVIATSFYSNKIAKKCGFKTEIEVAYKDYTDPITKENIFANVPEPHKAVSLLIKDL